MSKYIVKTGLEEMDFQAVLDLLHQAHWTKGRSDDVIKKSMENSICFGVFDTETGKQVGFSRVFTDYTTAYYLCDVIILRDLRKQGLGSMMIHAIITDPRFGHLRGVLCTTYASGFYRHHGFGVGEALFMERPREHY